MDETARPELSPAPVVTPAGPGGRRLALGLGAGLLALLLLLGLLGELTPFLSAGLTVVPYVVLAVLAALGEREGWARVLAYIGVILLGLGMLLASAGLVMIGALGPGALSGGGLNVDGNQALAALRTAGLYGLLGLVILLLSALPLIGGVRRALARWLPLRPESTMNAVGLSAALQLIGLPLAALVTLGGRPPALTLIAGLESSAELIRPLDQVYGFIWLLPATLIMVGYPILRQLRPTLERLGLVRPSGRQVLIGLAVAVGLVLVATVLDQAIAWLWTQMGWPRTDAKLFERLLGSLITPIGAVIIGVTAGLGEEVAVRGVLQPRLGLLLSNLAFTSLHAYQYGFDALLSVFLIGLVLGLLRARTNTSTAAIAHGTYDFILVMASALRLF